MSAQTPDTAAGRRPGQHLTEAVEGELQNLRDVGREYLTRGKERVMEIEEGFEGYVQEHPIRSVLIAAGVGIVLGALICRR